MPPTDPNRRSQILAIAADLVRRDGLTTLTTATLARAAKCSKETLYTLFDDREALIAAMIEQQAAALNDALTADLGPGDAEAQLVIAGERLLDLLTSETGLALNRAALSDPSGRWSALLLAHGRNRSAPLILDVLTRWRDTGGIAFTDPRPVYQAFYGLLMGDSQIAALHRDPAARPAAETRHQRAKAAVAGVKRLFS
jgi:AcrR family transcriptional regulator